MISLLLDCFLHCFFSLSLWFLYSLLGFLIAYFLFVVLFPDCVYETFVHRKLQNPTCVQGFQHPYSDIPCIRKFLSHCGSSLRSMSLRSLVAWLQNERSCLKEKVMLLINPKITQVNQWNKICKIFVVERNSEGISYNYIQIQVQGKYWNGDSFDCNWLK